MQLLSYYIALLIGSGDNSYGNTQLDIGTTLVFGLIM